MNIVMEREIDIKMNMQMLLIVLNRTDKLNPLLDAFMEKNIKGATILKSTGMVKMLAKDIEHYPIFGSLRSLWDQEERKDSRTLFLILPEELVETAKECVRMVVGDLSKPDTGIMVTMPLLSAEGMNF